MKIDFEDQLKVIDRNYIPQHIGIIMDGNRRWATRRKISHREGHIQGVRVAISMIKAVKDLGINTLTLFVFSTENWQRPIHEIKSLMSLFRLYIWRMRKELNDEKIRLHTIGDLSAFPVSLQKIIINTKNVTENNRDFNLILAINYGGRDEIRRAVIQLIKNHQKNPIDLEQFTEEYFATYLDTANWKDPDLLIRTSGEKRISNFLLWQISYTELYISDTLWPDFTKKDLIEAILEYQQRIRRLGG
ncbi:MAG: polyprenyl diphosphate synthase [Chlamydiales bacterium]